MGKSTRRVRIGTIIFYVLFFLFIGAFLFALNTGKGMLTDWLVQFEASQSTHKSQEIFAQLFEKPDWQQLYTLSNQQDTTYEGSEAFAAYMTKLVGDQKLTIAQTSAGLDKNAEKYLIKLGKENIGTLTIVNKTPEAPMPQWELGGLELYYRRLESTKIITTPGHTVYINGVALDDSHIIRQTFTLAEEYLPEGLQGYRQQMLMITDLLVQPQVTIRNAQGQEMEVVYDAESNTHIMTETLPQPTETIVNDAIAAAKMFARYMNTKDVAKTELLKYFDKEGKVYPTLPAKWELWLQSYKSYQFNEPVVRDYFPYSDTYYSIRVDLTLTVTRNDGSTKDYVADSTLFFEKKEDGKWLVVDKTNEDVQQKTTQVRLQYLVNSEKVHSEFITCNAQKLTLPTIEIPQGQKLVGWFTKEVDASGKTTMHLAFSPSEDGIVYFSEGTVLEPMVLYAQFEKE